MQVIRRFLFILLIAGSAVSGTAQFSVVRPSPASWEAQWITAPNTNGQDYGVFYFRKTIDLSTVPDSMIVDVSADNRYKLYVNDSLVSLGPARGDLHFWNYQTIDLAPFLRKGKNLLAATVWNEGPHRPEAQISYQTGFILRGRAGADILNTNKSWKVIRDAGYQALPGFFAASTGELIDYRRSPIQPMAFDTDDTNWLMATEMGKGQPRGLSDGAGWSLVPTTIPPMEMTRQRIPELRKTTGMPAPNGFPAQKRAVRIPANSRVSFLLDQTFLTNAYLSLQFSGGKNAGITLRYAESLYEEFNQYGGKKGNRDEIDGKVFSGRMDSLLSDGRTGQLYSNLNFRTYRYVQLTVITRDEDLVIDDIYGTFTGYPFAKTSRFEADQPEMDQILEIGWRTARLNAFETYTDCPYYEQLQYIGDTRVQAMISYYNTPDDRLARRAIDLIDQSRLPEGITQSRYPTRGTQLISTFSLWYIGMLHDYWMYRNDPAFIQGKLMASRAILDFFSKYQGADGSLHQTPYWTFVDWAGGDGWYVGNPPVDKEGGSAILDLQLLWAYQWAAELESKLGLQELATQYTGRAQTLAKTIRKKYWSPTRGLFADTREQSNFSQHANSLAILTGLIPEEQLPSFGNKLLSDKTLTSCTIYFKYYLHQALAKAGLGNQYLEWLDVWRNNIRMGLTTWTEDSNIDYSRSDCHAWGSSPNIEFFRIVLGIDTDAPGFRKVRIEPRLGKLTEASGSIPHPAGQIKADYRKTGANLNVRIQLPAGISGHFIWKKKRYPLSPGENRLQVPY